MSDCSKHKKEVAGITDMKVLAEMIGDLHYETLEELLGRLGTKLYLDGLNDRSHGRQLLGYALTDASDAMYKSAKHIAEAWHISKPFMQQQKNNNP